MTAKVVECVPNFSEGRRPEVVQAIVGAIASVAGVHVLDESSDAGHNRTVVTFLGPPEPVAEAAFLGVAKAVELIDMERHEGGHPRIGAADVVPFIPVAGVSMAECVALAETVGGRIAEELHVPVYLYEEAAKRPDRRRLEVIRRGQYESLKVEIAAPERHPDFGLPELHPTAGACVVGARPPLVAFNVNLATDDVEVAKRIAKAVRESSGGLVNVKAVGLAVDDGKIAQVSMNLVNTAKTPIYRAFELIGVEARRFGVAVRDAEIVGLVPAAALFDVAQFYLSLKGFDPERQVLERRLVDS